MAAQDEPALEAEQEVLANGLDAFQAPAVELLGDTGRPRPWIRAFDLDRLADEHLEASSGAMEGITLGHALDCERA
jgi:hypothetical protein